jgi:uncharacterized protein YdhG (YjbR/CyaY superfamily)
VSSSLKNNAKSAGVQVRAYLASLSPEVRRDLQKIRASIRSAAPGAEEHFSYGIPGFKLDGQPLVWYAAWKNHVSLYPMTAGIQRKHATDLKRYEVSKGTVRFPLATAPPVGLVKRLVKARIGELRKKDKA